MTLLVTTDVLNLQAKAYNGAGNIAAQANERNIPIVSEQDFLRLVQNTQHILIGIAKEEQQNNTRNNANQQQENKIASTITPQQQQQFVQAFMNNRTKHAMQKTANATPTSNAVATTSAVYNNHYVELPNLHMSFSFRKVSPFVEDYKVNMLPKTPRMTKTPGVKSYCELCGRTYEEPEDDHVLTPLHVSMAQNDILFQGVDDVFEELEEIDSRQRYIELLKENRLLMQKLTRLMQKKQISTQQLQHLCKLKRIELRITGEN